MLDKTQPITQSRTYKSVFFTSSFIVALCTAAVTATLALMFFNSAQRHAEDGVRLRATEVTTLIAKQSGGALKFRKAEVFEALLSDAIDGSDSAALAGTVFTETGQALISVGDPAAFNAGLDSLVSRALETGETVHSADRFTAIVPVRFGKDSPVIGLIAMRWTAEVLKDRHFQDQLVAMLVSGLVFLGGLAGAVLFLRMHISQPLVRLRDAMAEVAAKNYALEVPGVRRGDEVGEIARTLERFRDVLHIAAGMARDNIFKSAAFEDSTAAMLMIDREFTIQYVNSACRGLLDEFSCHFKSIDRNFAPAGVVGATIDTFLDRDGELSEAITDPDRLPFHSDIVAGDRRIHVTTSAVRDAAGAQIGCVLELKDATEDRLNRAAIESIDANQIRLEFSVDGHLNSANENFAAAVERPVKELIGKSLSDIFERYAEFATTTAVDLSELLRGEPLKGRFVAQNGVEPKVVFEGIFNLVYDRMGEPLRIVFIGSDITAERAAIEKSEGRRTALEQAQKVVVSSLSIALDRLAEGDLTGRIDGQFSAEYEGLRQNFNEAMNGLLTAIRNVASSAESIGKEAAGISAAADDLSHRTERQASTLEDTAIAVDELAQSVKLAASGASQASEMAGTTKLSAERNVDVVRETVSAMSEIDQGSSEISKIIKVIEDIAFQTNLLALNAGVEAARAGDSGRGFAVVATEVRSLAQRSAESAQEISALISKSGSQVKRGVDLVDQMGNAFDEIVQSVSEFADKVTGIASAVQEQSTNLDGINNAMADLDRTTRRNAAMFQETTAASHMLTQEAQLLAKTTQNFETGAARPAEAVTDAVTAFEHNERVA